MQSTTFYAIDFEGTRSSGVLESGVVIVKEESIVDTYTHLYCPQGPVTTMESAQHGLDLSLLKHHQTFATEYERFYSYRQQGVLIAHHAIVEDGLLRATWPYPGPVPSHFCSNLIHTWGPWIDTYVLYRQLYPGLPSYSLMLLIEQFQLMDELMEIARKQVSPQRCRPHAALFDAIACALLYLRLLKEPRLKQATLSWFLQNSAPSAQSKAALLQTDLNLY